MPDEPSQQFGDSPIKHIRLIIFRGIIGITHDAALAQPSVSTYGHLNQREHPADKKTHADHTKQITGKLAGRSRTHIHGKKRTGSDHGGPEKRHSRVASYTIQICITWQPTLPVNKNAVHYHHCIVDQHTHGHNECAEGNTLQGSAETRQYRKRQSHSQNQTESDYHTAAPAHGEHQHYYNYKHRLQQIQHESLNGITDFVRLKKYFLRLHSGRKTSHHFRHFGVDSLTNLRHNGGIFQCHGKRKSRNAVYIKGITLWGGISAGYTCHISQTDLFPLRSVKQQICEILFRCHSMVHIDRHPIRTGVYASGVYRLGSRLQRHHYLCRHQTVAGKLIRCELHVEHFSTGCSYVNAFYPRH